MELRHYKTFLRRAAILAWVSRVSYMRLELAVEEARKRWPVVYPLFAHPACGLVCWDDKELVIAIRGTDALDDMFYNLAFRQESFHGLQIHSGFKRYANRVLESVEGLAPPAGLRTFYTGHSLGGAAATILGAFPPFGNTARLSPSAVFTFGAPRCFCGSSSAKYVWPPVHRFVMCEDPVPDLPYRRIPFRYSHVGSVYLLPGVGQVEGEGCGWRSRWSRWVRYGWAACRSRLQATIRADHSVLEYERRLAPFLVED
jgi:hypothetical protein